MESVDASAHGDEIVRTERFSNGLEITASHVRLGDQTWAVHQIKRVGIGRAASGFGMYVCGLFFLFFGIAFLFALGGDYGGAPIIYLGITAWCGYGIYKSWDGVNNAQVWLQTGTLPVFVFKSRDVQEAERVKQLLEKAIAQHTPQ